MQPALLSTLSEIMKIEELNEFYLVGGTALALWLGHRTSIDLDFFIHSDFDAPTVAFALEKKFDAKNIETGKNLVRCYIAEIKIEFISHQYPLLKNIQKINGIRLASVEDICAFKLNAVVNRGSKKDFWDIACLLDQFQLNQILDFYSNKYKQFNLWQVEKSLCFFKDADEELVEINDLKGLNWETVKIKIKEASKIAF